MTVQLPSVAVPEALRGTAREPAPGFDERWAAWQARGVAHDRALRRKLGIAAPVVLMVAAVIVYALIGR